MTIESIFTEHACDLEPLRLGEQRLRVLVDGEQVGTVYPYARRWEATYGDEVLDGSWETPRLAALNIALTHEGVLHRKSVLSPIRFVAQ